MAKRAKTTFPKTIYVNREKDPNSDDDGYLLASDTANEVADGESVAIYDLRAVKVKRVSHDLT